MGDGFERPPLATEYNALKQDFILKLLKRTKMLRVAACRGTWGLARGLRFLPTQNAVEGLFPSVCEPLCVCAHVCARVCVFT